jgi:hypothetical protein
MNTKKGEQDEDLELYMLESRLKYATKTRMISESIGFCYRVGSPVGRVGSLQSDGGETTESHGKWYSKAALECINA